VIATAIMKMKNEENEDEEDGEDDEEGGDREGKDE